MLVIRYKEVQCSDESAALGRGDPVQAYPLAVYLKGVTVDNPGNTGHVRKRRVQYFHGDGGGGTSTGAASPLAI